jgi:hypothetical protein
VALPALDKGERASTNGFESTPVCFAERLAKKRFAQNALWIYEAGGEWFLEVHTPYLKSPLP